MIEPIKLLEYKETKKIRIIVEELTDLIRLLTLILKGLIRFKKYTPVKNILASILDNKAMLDIYLDKYKELLNEKTNKNKLEKSSKEYPTKD